MSLQKHLEKMHLRLGRVEPFVYVDSPDGGFWIMQYPITHEFLAGHVIAGSEVPSHHKYHEQLRRSLDNPGLPIVVVPDSELLRQFLSPYFKDGFRLPTQEEWLLVFGSYDPEQELVRSRCAYDLSPSRVIYVKRNLAELTANTVSDGSKESTKLGLVQPNYERVYGLEIPLDAAAKELSDVEDNVTIGARLVLPSNQHIPRHRIPGSSNVVIGYGWHQVSASKRSAPSQPQGYQGTPTSAPQGGSQGMIGPLGAGRRRITP